jgi:hypothetical protein
MSFGSPSLPPRDLAAPRRSDTDIAAEAALARRRAAGARGRSSTILAGEQTLGPVRRQTLLGAPNA